MTLLPQPLPVEASSVAPARRSLASIVHATAAPLSLAAAGVLIELILLGLWPVSYDLTQGAEFSHQYLLQYPDVWELFKPMFQRFEQTLPGAATSLEQLTGLLSLFWVGAFSVYFAAFLLVRRLPQRWWVALPILAFGLLFQATLFLMPGTFTTDLFSYAMYGYIPSVYDLNPYIYVPGFFPQNPLTAWIHPIWYFTPSIYGPLWIDLSIWLTGFTRDRSLVDQALVYRLVSNIAHLMNLGLVALLFQRFRTPTPVAMLLLFAWNPLLLFEYASSGHNDSLMLTFVLVALVLVSWRRHLLGVVALSAAALIKVTPVLLLPLLLAHWGWQQRGWFARIAVMGIGALVSLTLAIALYLPWYSGPDTFLLIEYWSKGPMYLNYLPDLPTELLVERVVDPGQQDPLAATELVRTWTKWLTRIVFLAYFGWELWRVRGITQLIAGMSRVFLVFLLLVNTWVLPWYFTWPLMLALPLGWERLQTRLLTAFSISAPLMMYNHHYWSVHMTPWLYLVYAAPLLLLLPVIWSGLGGRPRTHSERSGSPLLPGTS